MRGKTYRAECIVNHILDLGDVNHIKIDPLKLQKLLYISFGCCSYFMDREIFSDKIEAWKYGPVVPSIYYEFQRFGKKSINTGKKSNTTAKNRALIFDFFDDEKPLIASINPSDEELSLYLGYIFEGYKNLTSPQLVSLTHEKGTPWDNHYVRSKNVEIPKLEIKEYYRKFFSSK